MLLALTRSELWSMRYSDRPTSRVTIAARQRPASRVIFHWMESCRKGMGWVPCNKSVADECVGWRGLFFIQTFNLIRRPREALVIRRNMALLTSAAHCFRVRAFFLSQ
ncbi:hypothetical protein D3C79_691080 [compost metagenome]